MEPCRQRARRGTFFWLLVIGATIFLTIEPALFLVLLALTLSGVTLFWIVLLVRFLVLDTFSHERADREMELVSRSDDPG